MGPNTKRAPAGRGSLRLLGCGNTVEATVDQISLASSVPGQFRGAEALDR